MRTTNLKELSAKNDASQEESTRGEKQSLLVVEDNDMVRRLLVKILNLSGYQVLEAAHGREALEISDKHQGHIPLMVTDLVMPGMNGRELADEMLQRRPNMSVLFMSGYTDDPRMLEMLGERVDYLSKPFLPKSLINMIREKLDRSQVATDGTNSVGIVRVPAARRSLQAQSPMGNPNLAPATAWGKAAAATETRAFTLFLELIIGGLQ